MRSAEEKGCIYGLTEEEEEEVPSSNIATGFEFNINPKGNLLNRGSHHIRMGLSKPTPSKWDDAQKWLVGFSRGGGTGERSHIKTKPRNSNADDRRLIADVPQKENDFCSSSCTDDDEGIEDGNLQPQSKMVQVHDEGETKNVDSDQTIWRINNPSDDSYSSACSAIRSICFRDMGTEMSPIASQEPSRTATPLRDHMTPRAPARSPISSRSSTLERCDQQGVQISVIDESYQTGLTSFENRTTEAMHFGRDDHQGGATRWPNREEEEHNISIAVKAFENNKNNLEQARKSNPLETRAMAWDEAERTKYMARCKREEVKIQAWENHEKRKAEMKMRRMEVKAERLKSRAQEKLANKLAATRRIAEERRANAEAKLNEQAARTSERADYMRRTGHLPPSFSFKLPSLCW